VCLEVGHLDAGRLQTLGVLGNGLVELGPPQTPSSGVMGSGLVESGPPQAFPHTFSTPEFHSLQKGRGFERTLRLLGPPRSRAERLHSERLHSEQLQSERVLRERSPGQLDEPEVEHCEPAHSHSVAFSEHIVASSDAAQIPSTVHSTAAQRVLYFGLLGPHARQVSYRLRGREVSESVERGTGAYLIVLPSAATVFVSAAG
jgi:hypothetical protein